MMIGFNTLYLLLVIAPVPVCILRTRWSRNAAAALTAVALTAGAAAAIGVWYSGSPLMLDLTRFSPFTFLLSIDRLGGVFLFLVCAVSVPVVVFSVPYAEAHYGDARGTWYWILLPLFLLSMVLVVTGASVFAFFLGWELMTLLSTALIVLEGDSEPRRRSMFIYLLMMHAGAALVIAAFLLFAPYTPSLDFASIRVAAVGLPASLKTSIFLLAFVGFGTKAGIIPLHVWLPKAHPIAPTPVSALMSAVMLKTAVYAFLRFAFDFLGGGPRWGGYLVLAAGAVSAVLGILYAIFEIDMKRLLAYSSVENIGIIYLAIGAALVCFNAGAPAVAALALLAALVHCLNHAIFKSLLFLGAGAIHHHTHTFNLNEMGGLHKRMRVTAVLFLVGCVSIAGLPLFSGFIGEWIAFQSFLSGAQVPDTAVQIVLPLMAGVLALTGGLAAACFVNVYGSTFLGRPRTAATTATAAVTAPTNDEAPRSMLAPLAALASACVVIGLVPWVLVRPLWSLAQELVPGADYTAVAAIQSGISKAAIIVLLAGVCAALVRVAVRTSAIWACGLSELTSRMQYTASCFSKPLRTVFATVYKPDRKLEMLPADRPYAPSSISYQSRRTTSYEQTLYRPIFDSLLGLAQQLRRLQTGNIQLYLLYIFIALLSMLLLMRFR
ncbi:MAG: proton-conducting transporter membrane subunit [Actinomycetota bacterium]